jgi:hypothetical protein
VFISFGVFFFASRPSNRAALLITHPSIRQRLEQKRREYARESAGNSIWQIGLAHFIDFRFPWR